MEEEALVDNWPLYGTNEEKEYRFRELKGTAIRFLIKAPHDCHLAFTSAAEETSLMFEVFIGAWEGQSSAIRFNKTDDLVKVDTPDILSEDETREFWVTFDNGVARVGKGNEWEPFMAAALPTPFQVTHFGYSTGWGSCGWFQFFNERVLQTDDKLEYVFEPVYGDSFSFSVACNNDAHVALTSSPEETTPMYEVFIGGWGNQNSAIRLNKGEDLSKVDTPDITCSENMRSFWITFQNGHIKVGSYGNPEPFMEWQDSEPWKVTHIGYCTGWGSCGKWKLGV